MDWLKSAFSSSSRPSYDFSQLNETVTVGVLRLVESRNNKLTLIATMDGQSFLTGAQLSKEIGQAVRDAGGRLDLVALQSILNVDLSEIEKRVDTVKLTFRDGELFSDLFADRMLSDLVSWVRASGQVTVPDVAHRFDLSAAHVRDLLAAHADRIAGKLLPVANDDDRLITPEHAHQLKARAVDALTSLREPTSLAELAQQHQLEEHMLHECARTECAAVGKLIGADKLFVPHSFEQDRRRGAFKFFQDNGYLDYKTLDEINVTSDKERHDFFAEMGLSQDSVVYLSSCCVSPVSVVYPLDSVIAEYDADGGCLEVDQFILSHLTDSGDRELLVRACDSYTRARLLPLQRYSVLVSLRLVDAGHDLVRQIVKQQLFPTTNDAAAAAAADDMNSATSQVLKQLLCAKPLTNHCSEDVIRALWERSWSEPCAKLIVSEQEAAVARLTAERPAPVAPLTSADTRNREKFQATLAARFYYITHLNETARQISSANADIISRSDLDSYLFQTLCQECIHLIESYFSSINNDNALAINELRSCASVDEFLSKLRSSASQLDLYFTELDKKKEKSLVYTQKHQLKQQIANDNKFNDPTKFLHAVLLYLFVLHYKRILHTRNVKLLHSLVAKQKIDSELSDLLIQALDEQDGNVEGAVCTKIKELIQL